MIKQENTIVFKATKDGLIILLDETIPFEELKSNLSQKVIDSKNFFGDTKTNIFFKGRELNTDEENTLVEIISKESNLDISLAKTMPEKPTPTAKPQKAKPPQKVKSPFPSNLKELTAISSARNDTLFHTGSVRSGQVLRYQGSIVIMGDVNPGGEVIAYGNIIVLGSIKGLVHAGYPRSYDCYIAALEIGIAQIRIADHIVYISAENLHNTSMPSKVYTKEKRIMIEPIR